MINALYACPVCHIEGFTFAGLGRHHCHAKAGRARLTAKEIAAVALVAARAEAVTKRLMKASSLSPSSQPMSKPSSKKPASALVVLEDKTLAPEAARFGKFQAATIEQLELVAATERDNTQRRLVIGLALTVIKAGSKHGSFIPWLKKHVKSSGYTQCTYMMRAARVFFEQTKLGRDDVLTLVSGNGTLAITTEGPATKIQKAAAKFVGEMTWGELLAKHDIRPTEKPVKPKPTEPTGDDETPAAAATPEQLYTQSRDELGSFLERGAMLFKTENRLQYLADHPEEIAGVVTSLRTLLEEVEAVAKPLLKTAKK
ncbi:MAG TPA: hypothetical protein VK985_09470 [Rariglobus sp.]|nr:hypothetical protein [Rariglobus sp.]